MEQVSLDEISADTSQSTYNPRARRDWELVWSNESAPGVTLASFVQSVPTFSRRRNDPARCQLDHLSRDDQDHVPIKHQMRRVVTKCKSTRCKESGRPCGCRYKILICEPGGLARAYVEGEHTMSDPAVSSPTPIRLTNEMKSFIEDRLEEDASMTPLDLHGRVWKMVSTGRMEGPEPLDTQVQSHVKQWRYHNQRDAMQPVLDLCARSMVESIDDVQQSGKNLLILCDTKYEEGKRIPNLGTGHKTSPFRIGLTCFTLLENYVTVQRDPRCTTILHVDSTHSVVKQRYPVFVFGISDCGGTFFPVVYFCTSQRTGEDVGWCCAHLKRVIWNTFMVQFLPRFVMTDADDAQFNACVKELPTAKILMCWFHVAQNVKAHVDKAKLDPVTINMIFRDLNNLHFARDEEEYLTRRANVLVAWNAASSFSPEFKVVSDHIIAQWILHPRFSCWQSYLTPPGYAKTNNILEQYHKTLKLVNKSKKATPTELVDRLDRSRMVFMNKKTAFSSVPSVSQRMKALYNLARRKKEIIATPLPTANDLPPHLVQVRHCPRSKYGDTESFEADDFFVEDPKKKNLPYKSIHVLRMQWRDMPKDGWVVDARLRTCGCRFKAKYGLCIHVILGTRELLLPCPGMPDCIPRFVSNSGQSRSKPTQRPSRKAQRIAAPGSAALLVAGPASTGGVMHGPHPRPSNYGGQSDGATRVFGPHQSAFGTGAFCVNHTPSPQAAPLVDGHEYTTSGDASIAAEQVIEQPDIPILSNHFSSFTAMLNEVSASPPWGHHEDGTTRTSQEQPTPRASCDQTKRRRF